MQRLNLYSNYYISCKISIYPIIYYTLFLLVQRLILQRLGYLQLVLNPPTTKEDHDKIIVII